MPKDRKDHILPNHMAEGIPMDIQELYQKEVSALLQELDILSRASEGNGVLKGESLLRAALSSRNNTQASEILEWMLEELEALLSLHASAMEGNPDYTAQAVRELLDNCRDRMAVVPAASVSKIAEEIKRRREAGVYQAEAELMSLSYDIGVMSGHATEGSNDMSVMAEQLEKADYARLLAHLAPEVQREREKLGKINYIATPKDMSGLFSTLLSQAVH